jgi:hypothetical protein
MRLSHDSVILKFVYEIVTWKCYSKFVYENVTSQRSVIVYEIVTS